MRNIREMMIKPFLVAHSYSSLVAVTPIFLAAKTEEKKLLTACHGMEVMSHVVLGQRLSVPLYFGILYFEEPGKK